MDGTVWLVCAVIAALAAYALGCDNGARAERRVMLEMVERIERGEE